jgi:hypothetical protein
VAESGEEAARRRFRWSEGSTQPHRSSQLTEGRRRGSWQRAVARCGASLVVDCRGEGVKKVHVTPRSLRKQDWDKRLAGVGELRRRSLVPLFTKMGENGNGVGSVVHWGFGVAEEPHGAYE